MEIWKGEAETRFNPEMLTLARESRGLTQSSLAGRLSVTQGTLSRVEAGLRVPSDDLVASIGEVLDYPADFFYQSARVYGLGVGRLFHRMRSGISARHMHMVCAQINLLRMHLECFLKSVDLVDVRIPAMELGDYGDAASIARAIRALWQLPNGPVADLTRSIEDAGGVVLALDFGIAKIDALSISTPGLPPMFFVSKTAPGDRLRFSLAHELGHLVMHQNDPNPNMEKQADIFAAEFLMPQHEIRGSLATVDLPKLATLKTYWKVSMSALVKRAENLGCITDSEARTLWIKMSKLGYRMREPAELEIPRETPTLFDEIVGFFKHDLKYTPREMARLLRRSESDVLDMFYPECRGLRVVK